MTIAIADHAEQVRGNIAAAVLFALGLVCFITVAVDRRRDRRRTP